MNIKVVGTISWCLFVAQVSFSDDAPIVKTQQGKLQGKLVTLKDGPKSAFAFLDIPFAAPPVGDLRFEPPQPVEPWEGLRDATKYGLPCPQPKRLLTRSFREELGINIRDLEETNEDCLHLNVYTSALSGKRPVMVFMHGGGFMGGWASCYDLSAYAILHDVLGVVIQYRLGPLGLLNSGDGIVTGNQAFKDQVAALRWVQENIAQFGGDPDQVTIFGESAGSVSVSMHLISPASTGLFHRAIMHSGAIVDAGFAPPIQPEDEMMKLASVVGCPNSSSVEAVKCLRMKPADQLVDPSGKGVTDFQNMIMFVPSLEEGYFPDVPNNMYQNGHFNRKIEVISGFCSVEGFMLSKDFIPGFPLPNFNMAQFQAIVGGVLETVFPPKMPMAQIVAAITKAYTKGQDNPDMLNHALATFQGDLLITIGTLKSANIISGLSDQSLYMFEFSARPPTSTRPPYITADHGDDLFFALGYSHLGHFDGVPLNIPEDLGFRRVEHMVMSYWANFAKTGNPNGDGLPEWPSFRDGGSRMVLSAQPYVGYIEDMERMDFWFKTLPALLTPPQEGQKEEL